MIKGFQLFPVHRNFKNIYNFKTCWVPVSLANLRNPTDYQQGYQQPVISVAMQ